MVSQRGVSGIPTSIATGPYGCNSRTRRETGKMTGILERGALYAGLTAAFPHAKDTNRYLKSSRKTRQ